MRALLSQVRRSSGIKNNDGAQEETGNSSMSQESRKRREIAVWRRRAGRNIGSRPNPGNRFLYYVLLLHRINWYLLGPYTYQKVS